MLEHHALDREAPRPFKRQVMLQSHHVKRVQVAVDRQWLLQYPDGRVAMFVRLSDERGEPPVWVPVLRVSRRREAWMNLRHVTVPLHYRDSTAALPLHYRCITATVQLHDRYVTVTLPSLRPG